MANSDQLRANKNQHIPKNIQSKKDDKNIFQAQNKVEEYLKSRFKEYFTEEEGYYTELKKRIYFKEMHNFIKDKKSRQEFDTLFRDRNIQPDGGILYLKNRKDKNFIKVLLVAEVKRQGTNDKRKAEGKPKQAQGNAIERLGKNLTGIKAMMNHEKITPFVCFCSGHDFATDADGAVLDGTINARLSMLNEFYYLNKIYIFKKDGDSNHNYFSPVSMYCQGEEWNTDKMFEIMKEISETSFRYYMH